jgi:alpha-tubulin suppressor-like RCC1 family protein
MHMDVTIPTVLLLGLILVAVSLGIWVGGRLRRLRRRARRAARRAHRTAMRRATGAEAGTPTTPDAAASSAPRILGLEPVEPPRKPSWLRRWGLGIGAIAVTAILLIAGALSRGGAAEGGWAYHPTTSVRTDPTDTNGSGRGSAEPEAAVDPVDGTRLIVWSGSGQTGEPGRLLRRGLAVVVQDSTGRPIPGAEVRFAVARGGGRVEPGRATTSDLGLAMATWWLGTDPDSLRVAAQLVSAPDLQVEFTATHRDETESPPVDPGEARMAAGGAEEPGTTADAPPGATVRTPIAPTEGTAEVAAEMPAGAPEAAPAAAPAAPAAVATGEPAPGAVAAGAPTRARAPAGVPVRGGARLTAGGVHTCRLLAGDVVCWGGHESGSGGSSSSGPPAGAPSLLAVSAGLFHSCGVTTRETVYCWPVAASPPGSPKASPVELELPGGAIPVEVVAGAEHSCALSRDGRVFCWGSNAHGQLGDGTTSDGRSPVPVAGLARVVQLASGWMHTCAVTRSGAVYCWGANGAGQVSEGPRVRTRATPVEHAGAFVHVTAGSAHSCALTDAGQVWCWGSNEHGQLGTGGPASDRGPRPVAGDLVFRAVATGGVHTCGLTNEGAAWCWGRNTFGQLGNDTGRDSNRPSPVAGERSLVTLDAGGSHTCGETADGRVYCWGNNIQGQVGDGTRDNKSAPVAVARGGRR